MNPKSNYKPPTRTQCDDSIELKDSPTARAWQRMLSGRRLDLLNPSKDDIAIEDIAHGLARVARWNGQTTGDHAFSVAQHVLLVERITDQQNPGWDNRWRLASLLHDAAEYVVGDLISPFKNAIGLDYKEFEARLMCTIHEKFALPTTLPNQVQRAIKVADRIAAFYEATQLAGFANDEARHFFGDPPQLGPQLDQVLQKLRPKPPAYAQEEFLMRFNELCLFTPTQDLP